MFGVHRKTVRKMLEHPVPPGYRMRRPRRRRKLERFTAIIDRILRDDLDLPSKRRQEPTTSTTRPARIIDAPVKIFDVDHRECYR